MGPSSPLRSLLAFVVAACCVGVASSAVLGIDYGSEYLKVSIVAPGRTPISVVINEISKRKSTAAVSFTGGDRWLAEEAMNYNARFPDRVFTRLRDLLGKPVALASFQARKRLVNMRGFKMRGPRYALYLNPGPKPFPTARKTAHRGALGHHRVSQLQPPRLRTVF